MIFIKGVPIFIFISASAISAYRHFFSISAYRLSANILSADIADIWISAFGDISAKYRLKYRLNYGTKMVINNQFSHFLNSLKRTMPNCYSRVREKQDFTPSGAIWAEFTQTCAHQATRGVKTCLSRPPLYLRTEQFSGRVVTCEPVRSGSKFLMNRLAVGWLARAQQT